jgi:hypothetical protein
MSIDAPIIANLNAEESAELQGMLEEISISSVPGAWEKLP